MIDEYEGTPPLYDPREDREDDSDRFEIEVNEEAYYFSVLQGFIALVEKYGFDKVDKDMGELLACHRRFQGA